MFCNIVRMVHKREVNIVDLYILNIFMKPFFQIILDFLELLTLLSLFIFLSVKFLVCDYPIIDLIYFHP